MKTIKELIDFVRTNPKFFPDQFYQRVSGRNIIFDKGNFMVICSTGEIAVNCETELSADEIKSKIFSTFQETTISKMQEHLETLYLAALEPSLDKIKNNPKSHFIFEDDDIMTIKGCAAGIDTTNRKALFPPNISPEQKISALTEFFEKTVLEKRRLNAEKVFETKNHEAISKIEKEALDKRKSKAIQPSSNPNFKKPSHKRGDEKDLRKEVLLGNVKKLRAENTQNTSSV